MLATRTTRALKILERLVAVIAAGDGAGAERLARDDNGHAREQTVDILSTSLAGEITLPRPRDADPTIAAIRPSRAPRVSARRETAKKRDAWPPLAQSRPVH